MARRARTAPAGNATASGRDLALGFLAFRRKTEARSRTFRGIVRGSTSLLLRGSAGEIGRRAQLRTSADR